MSGNGVEQNRFVLAHNSLEGYFFTRRPNRRARLALEAVFAERLRQCRYGTNLISEGTLRVQKSRSLSEG